MPQPYRGRVARARAVRGDAVSRRVKVVDVECETPAEYRWLRQLAARAPSKVELTPEGQFRVLDSQWFARALAACNGKVLES